MSAIFAGQTLILMTAVAGDEARAMGINSLLRASVAARAFSGTKNPVPLASSVIRCRSARYRSRTFSFPAKPTLVAHSVRDKMFEGIGSDSKCDAVSLSKISATPGLKMSRVQGVRYERAMRLRISQACCAVGNRATKPRLALGTGK